jgi:hypothetical protein
MAGVAAVLLACTGADAAAIHRASSHGVDWTTSDVRDLPDFKEWSKYLLAGPTVWAKVEHPPVTDAIRSAIWQSVRTDPGGTDPMVDFLLWKQSLDPTRFAHYHPKLAPALHRIELARSSPTLVSQATPPTTTTGSTGPSPTPPTVAPQNLIPGAAPEPGTLLLAACMMAWAVRTLHHRDRYGDE